MSQRHLTNLPPYALQNPRAYHFWPGPQAPTGSIRPCLWTSWKRRLTGEWLMTISSSERNSTWVLCWGWCISREKGRPKVKPFEWWGRKQVSNGFRGTKFSPGSSDFFPMWSWAGNEKKKLPCLPHLPIYPFIHHCVYYFCLLIQNLTYMRCQGFARGAKADSPCIQGTWCVCSNRV